MLFLYFRMVSRTSLADFVSCGNAFQVHWFIEHSSDWQLLEGAQEGLSQVHACVYGDEQLVVFDHPVDVRLCASSVLPLEYRIFQLAKIRVGCRQVAAAAPKLNIEIYQTDELQRFELAGGRGWA